jgi:hypothetical protein
MYIFMDFKAQPVFLKASYVRKTNKLNFFRYIMEFVFKPLFYILIWLKYYSGQVNFIIPKLFIKIVRLNVQIRLLITFV